jgi:hypothetical protein
MYETVSPKKWQGKHNKSVAIRSNRSLGNGGCKLEIAWPRDAGVAGDDVMIGSSASSPWFHDTNQQGSWFVTKITDGYDYNLYRDSIAPVLKGKTNHQISKISREKVLRFTFTDKGSGVKKDGVSLQVNGKKRDIGFFASDHALEVPFYASDGTGTHRYTLTVKDRAGNLTVKSGKVVIGQVVGQKKSEKKKKNKGKKKQ